MKNEKHEQFLKNCGVVFLKDIFEHATGWDSSFIESQVSLILIKTDKRITIIFYQSMPHVAILINGYRQPTWKREYCLLFRGVSTHGRQILALQNGKKTLMNGSVVTDDNTRTCEYSESLVSATWLNVTLSSPLVIILVRDI